MLGLKIACNNQMLTKLQILKKQQLFRSPFRKVRVDQHKLPEGFFSNTKQPEPVQPLTRLKIGRSLDNLYRDFTQSRGSSKNSKKRAAFSPVTLRPKNTIQKQAVQKNSVSCKELAKNRSSPARIKKVITQAQVDLPQISKLRMKSQIF